MKPIKIGTNEIVNNFNNLYQTLKETAESEEKVLIDLHIHTSYSHETGCDLTPFETLEKLQALAELLKTHIVFSITDHENILGSKKAIKEMNQHPEKYRNLTCISGVEFNTSLKSVEMKDGHSTYGKLHMLGLGYNIYDKELNAYSKLVQIKFRKVYPINSKKQNKLKYVNTGKQIIGSIHKIEREYNIKINYSLFSGLENLTSHQEIYNEFFRICKVYFKNCKIKEEPKLEDLLSNVFFPEPTLFSEQGESLAKLDVFKCIELIKNAGGKAVIAHPNSIRYEQNHYFGSVQEVLIRNLVKIIQEKSKNGLDGLEIFHSSNFRGKAASNFFKIAEDFDLFISGGSDFHGALYKDKIIGSVFPQKFNEIRKEKSKKNKEKRLYSHRLAYLPLIDNILYNTTAEKTDFIVTSYGEILTKEDIIHTSLIVGEHEKTEKIKGNNIELEEHVVTQIYKGKPYKKESEKVEETEK